MQKHKEKNKGVRIKMLFSVREEKCYHKKNQKLSCSTFDKVISVIYLVFRDAFSYVCT